MTDLDAQLAHLKAQTDRAQKQAVAPFYGCPKCRWSRSGCTWWRCNPVKYHAHRKTSPWKYGDAAADYEGAYLKIGEEKKVYSMPGGCTVLVALFILGKLYVANAGDSRAVLTRSSRAYPMSYDFTPVTERTRLQTLGRLAPQLLGSEYTWLEYVRRPTRCGNGEFLDMS